MSQSIKRKDFLTLTISIATLSAVSAVGCGDDDDSSGDGGAGKSGGGGTAGSGGKNGTAGSSAGNSPEGGKNNNGGTGGKNNGGSGGANGGTGGKNNGGSAGKMNNGGEGGVGGDGGAGGESYGGESYGGEGGAGGAGGDGPGAAPKCGGAHLTHDAVGHNHLIGNVDQQFTVYVNASDHNDPFPLPMELNHSHGIELSKQDIDTLRAGGMITKDSKGGTHTHTYKISCG